MDLSLRARGLLSLIQSIRSGDTVTVPTILEHISGTSQHIKETPKYVYHIIDELVEVGALSRTGDNEYRVCVLSNDVENYQEPLSVRINRLFRGDRVYDLVAWFLDAEGLEFNNDKALIKRVRSEYDSAKVVQFWENEIIFASYAEVLSKNPDKILTMADVLECLNNRKSTYE